MTPKMTKYLVFVHSNLCLLLRKSFSQETPQSTKNRKLNWGYCRSWLFIGRQWNSSNC